MGRPKRNGLPSKPQVFITKEKFIEAVKDSAGIKTEIARRIGCNIMTLIHALQRDDWADMRELYEQEFIKFKDMSKNAVLYAINQRKDIASALRGGMWYLSKKAKDEGFGDDLELKGTINHNIVDVEKLDLPLEVLLAIKKAIENKRKK